MVLVAAAKERMHKSSHDEPSALDSRGADVVSDRYVDPAAAELCVSRAGPVFSQQ